MRCAGTTLSEATASPPLAELLAGRDGAFVATPVWSRPEGAFVALQSLAAAHIEVAEAIGGGLLRAGVARSSGVTRQRDARAGGAASGGPVQELQRALEEALAGEPEAVAADREEGPSAADWRAELDRVRAEAFAAGLEEGRRQAEAAYGVALADVGAVVARAEMATRIDRAPLAADLVQLVTELTRAVVEAQPVLAPELLLPRIERAVEALRAANEPCSLHVNPADAALVRAQFKARLRRSRLKLVEDGDIARGGFRLATAEANLEDTLELRLARLRHELGDCAAELARAAA